MSSKSTDTIGYDIRAVWRRDLGWSVRPLSSADRPGLDHSRRARPMRSLVGAQKALESHGDTHRAWALEKAARTVGAVAASVSEQATRETPLPWSKTTRDALEIHDRPALLIESIFWEREADLDAHAVLRDTICNAVQLESFCEVWVELPFEPTAYAPQQWLMMLHSAYHLERWNDAPIAAFLEAGFELQGWYEAAAGRLVARLNWTNRAR